MVQTNTKVCSREFLSMSLDQTHYKIMDLIAHWSGGKALDFPSGSGRLAWWLHEKGFDVVAADSQPKNFQNPELLIVSCDLDQPFPFKDNAFDCAFCVDGPEHAENLYHTFREFARVLGPKGNFVVSYPNYSNIESRLRNVFYGVLEPVEPPEIVRDWRRKGIKDNGHINRQPYALLRMALEYAGFRIEKITSEKTKSGQLLLLPLFLLGQAFTRIKGEKGRKKYWLHESNSYPVFMGGNDLILLCTLDQ